MLFRSSGRVKPAVLVLKGLSPEAADKALLDAGGSLRGALQKLA